MTNSSRDVDLVRRRLLASLASLPALAACGRVSFGPPPAELPAAPVDDVKPKRGPYVPNTPGTLRVESVPAPAVVIIDGNVVGHTPLDVEVAAGTHEIELGLSGWQAQKRTIEMKAGDKLALSVELVEARLPVPGRAFVVDGALTTATLRATAPSDAPCVQAFLDDALLEHASIASFARAALELMALGAPVELVAEHQRASLDEAAHAELCLALARARGADVDSASPFGAMAVAAPREASYARLARDVVVEGCVGETVAVLHARRSLRAAESAVAEGRAASDVVDALRVIIDDEERHAALAWRTLHFAMERGGDDAALAARAALDDELARLSTSAAAGDAVARDARDVVRDVARALVGPSPSAERRCAG